MTFKKIPKELIIIYILFFCIFFLGKIAIDYFMFGHTINDMLFKNLAQALIATGLFFFLTRKNFFPPKD